MKWIGRLVLAVALGLMLQGWVEHRLEGYSEHRSVIMLASVEDGVSVDSWWDQFVDRLQYVIYGPKRPTDWLNAPTA